jgi:hypothetical protein
LTRLHQASPHKGSRTQRLHQPIQKILSFEELFDTDAFVATVFAVVFEVADTELRSTTPPSLYFQESRCAKSCDGALIPTTLIRNLGASFTDSASVNTSATSVSNRIVSPKSRCRCPSFLTRSFFRSYSGRSSSIASLAVWMNAISSLGPVRYGFAHSENWYETLFGNHCLSSNSSL